MVVGVDVTLNGVGVEVEGVEFDGVGVDVEGVAL